MANIIKSTMGSVGNLFEHYGRKENNEKAVAQSKKNKNIDVKRTKLNYNLAPDRGVSQLEYLKKRMGEVHHQKRKDLNVLCTWCVTQPKDFEGKTEDFMKETYKFLSDKYGEKNVISAWVHMDETTPHMHFAFVPVVFDQKKNREKISAKELINRRELQKFHGDLQNHLEKALGCTVNILNGATRDGNKTVVQLKRETALDEKLGEIQKEVDNAFEEADKAFKLREEYQERLKTVKAELEGAEMKLSNLPSQEEIKSLEEVARVLGGNEQLLEPKKKFGGKWVLEFDSEHEARKIQETFLLASHGQKTYFDYVKEGKERAEQITKQAEKEAQKIRAAQAAEIAGYDNSITRLRNELAEWQAKAESLEKEVSRLKTRESYLFDFLKTLDFSDKEITEIQDFIDAKERPSFSL